MRRWRSWGRTAAQRVTRTGRRRRPRDTHALSQRGPGARRGGGRGAPRSHARACSDDHEAVCSGPERCTTTGRNQAGRRPEPHLAGGVRPAERHPAAQTARRRDHHVHCTHDAAPARMHFDCERAKSQVLRAGPTRPDPQPFREAVRRPQRQGLCRHTSGRFPAPEGCRAVAAAARARHSPGPGRCLDGCSAGPRNAATATRSRRAAQVAAQHCSGVCSETYRRTGLAHTCSLVVRRVATP